MRTRTVKGPFGPHAAKKEFYHKGKWHFLKWVSKAQYTVKRTL